MAAPLGLREVGCVSLVALTAAYLRWLQRRLPPGVRRLAAALPVVAAFLLAPLLFDPWSEPAHVILAINLPWLSNSAVLGWAAGRGPLAQPRLPFHAFLAFLGAPALPAALEPAFPPYRFSLAAAAARAALLAAAAYGMACYRLAPWAVGVLQSLALYCFTSGGMETAALTAALLSGERVVAPFDRPFLAGSLRHFWRRWNVVAGLKFRHTLHDPICAAGQRQQTQQKQHESDGAPAARRPSPARRMLGVCAVMTASGAVHELALWYLTRRFSGWWMLFFSVQGPLLIAEAWLRTLARQAGIRMPRPLGTAATLLLMHTLARLLFYPDLAASGVPARLLQQLWPPALGSSICSPLGNA